jgi:CMP-N,N'-diacetyllegionaminic acid synthase
MKALVVIPARGGSKGLPGKNIKLLNGKPMINYTVEAARAIFSDKDIIVSTDSEEIKNIVEETGLQVPFLRPTELATDTATTQDVLFHALDFYLKSNERPDVLILLQVTSPLRTSKHIKEALSLYTPDMDVIVSVKETDANPYYVLFEENEEGFLKKTKEADFTRRQDCPSVWELNGAIYIYNIASIDKRNKKMTKYVMDKKSSIDVDDEVDFNLVNLYLGKC